MNQEDKAYQDYIKTTQLYHRIPRRSLRKKLLKMAVIFTAPIRHQANFLHSEIEKLVNESFMTTAMKESSVKDMEKLFVGGVRLNEKGEAIYEGKG